MALTKLILSPNKLQLNCQKLKICIVFKWYRQTKKWIIQKSPLMCILEAARLTFITIALVSYSKWGMFMSLSPKWYGSLVNSLVGIIEMGAFPNPSLFLLRKIRRKIAAYLVFWEQICTYFPKTVKSAAAQSCFRNNFRIFTLN